jgi:hypothetical protein
MGRKENKIERRLADGVKALGGMTFKFISPGAAGVPDRVVILPGGTVHFVELKSDGGTASKLQQRMIQKLRRLDVTAVVLTGRNEVEHYLDNLRELMNE